MSIKEKSNNICYILVSVDVRFASRNDRFDETEKKNVLKSEKTDDGPRTSIRSPPINNRLQIKTVGIIHYCLLLLSRLTSVSSDKGIKLDAPSGPPTNGSSPPGEPASV